MLQWGLDNGNVSSPCDFVVNMGFLWALEWLIQAISSSLGGISSSEAENLWSFRYYVLILPAETITTFVKLRTMYQNDDTRINSQRDTQSESSKNKTNRFSKQALKFAASAFAGMMAGARAMWAGEAVASRHAGEEGESQDNHAGNPTIEQPAEAGVAAPQPEAQPKQELQPESQPEPQPEPQHGAESHSAHAQSQPQSQHSHQPQPEPTPDPQHTGEHTQSFAEAHDIHIDEIRVVEGDDGETVRVGLGTVDSHASMFFLDDNNGVVGTAVDVNDNGQFEENEVIDLRDQHLTLQDNGTLQPVNETQEVSVVAIDETEINGQSVTVARVTMGEEQVALVDVNQDGEVNLLLHDDNSNGSIEENEVHDVTDQHIPMPMADDIQPSDDGMMIAQNDELPDYSNDADITMYEA